MHLVRRLIDVQLSDQPDSTQWKLAKNGGFTVKSFYMDLINSGSISRSLHIWKIKVSLRIKTFYMVCPQASNTHQGQLNQEAMGR